MENTNWKQKFDQRFCKGADSPNDQVQMTRSEGVEFIEELVKRPQKQFKKIVLLLRNAQDFTDHDEEILSLVSKFTGLELPTPQNYPEGRYLFSGKAPIGAERN